MIFVRRISIYFMLSLFLSLAFGIEIYSVHCHMRNEKFISLMQGMDPCLTEEAFHEEENHSCCASKKECLNEENDEEHGCCDEEEIHISYEPDAFSQSKLSVSFLLFVPTHHIYSDVHIELVTEEQLLSEFPQPPPLSGRQILSLHCVYRI